MIVPRAVCLGARPRSLVQGALLFLSASVIRGQGVPPLYYALY